MCSAGEWSTATAGWRASIRVATSSPNEARPTIAISRPSRCGNRSRQLSLKRGFVMLKWLAALAALGSFATAAEAKQSPAKFDWFEYRGDDHLPKPGPGQY